MPSEGGEHPYDHDRPAKSRGQCWAVRAQNCVTWKCTKQFPFYYGKTSLTMSARIRRAEILNDTHADYVNGDENDWIWFLLFVFSMFSMFSVSWRVVAQLMFPRFSAAPWCRVFVETRTCCRPLADNAWQSCLHF